MKPVQTHEVTQLLRAWMQGEAGAESELYKLVYAELHRMAHRYMSRENPGQTLQTTALVNEAYLKMADAKNSDWKDRAHFFAVSANIMRHILVDRARSKQAVMHGGGLNRIDWDDVVEIPEAPNVDYLALNEALDRLAEMDERKSRIVELRFFGGLTNEEIAEVLKVSADTVMRDWRFAKAWLQSELNGDNSHESANGSVRSTYA
ncbi:MAG: sigma-70 family RNA polymerase sigma factor [Acidobacteria bacterium]|nr:sigma-70 family RNA polymerase sigma factor [Acidobacteriota bacterium]